MLSTGQGILASQPFSALLGAELTAFAPGLATIELANRADFAQQFGLVHGGVLSYLADNALTFAGGTVLGASVLTAEYKINYVRAARGERLIARATVIAATARQAVCRCDVFIVSNGSETLCATAQGTIVKTGD
ncbi:MAG: PaaI family thioesterase [Ktedonobacterales bacterium]|nr:PaaI family thioesterase [Ktedonobacterales bacterium]